MKIDFEITKNGLTFRDAIHLEDDHGLTDLEIEEIKQKRFDAWYSIITAPSEVIEENNEETPLQG